MKYKKSRQSPSALTSQSDWASQMALAEKIAFVVMVEASLEEAQRHVEPRPVSEFQLARRGGSPRDDEDARSTAAEFGEVSHVDLEELVVQELFLRLGMTPPPRNKEIPTQISAAQEQARLSSFRQARHPDPVACIICDWIHDIPRNGFPTCDFC